MTGGDGITLRRKVKPNAHLRVKDALQRRERHVQTGQRCGVPRAAAAAAVDGAFQAGPRAQLERLRVSMDAVQEGTKRAAERT